MRRSPAAALRASRSLRSLLLLLLLGLLGVAGVWAERNREHLGRFPKIISAYYAKELCSCLFVLEREEPFCHELVRQYVPISGFQIDRGAKEVEVRGLWRRSRARYVSERLGCRLEE